MHTPRPVPADQPADAAPDRAADTPHRRAGIPAVRTTGATTRRLRGQEVRLYILLVYGAEMASIADIYVEVLPVTGKIADGIKKPCAKPMTDVWRAAKRRG